MRKQTNVRAQNGFSLLEVIIGIFIFVVGILALASLQGALTRSMADAKVHTVAVNLAEQQIERIKAFTQLQVDAVDPTIVAYNAIVDKVIPLADLPPIEGVTYTLTQDVTDYYYQLSGDNFTTTVPTGATASDYKVVEITVIWDDDREFRLDEGSETAGNLDTSAGIKISAIVPAIVSSASARVATQTTGGGELAPDVGYTPGLRPDIVALTLDTGKFKESLTPEPDVTREEELVETRFEVITYSTGSGSSVFLRREEFAAVSCECTLQAASSSNLARRPVVWAGDEYAGGQFVQKDYGVSANNQQTSLCDTCCRDHHDSAFVTGDNADKFYNVYGPFKGNDEYTGTVRESDHKHYLEDLSRVAGVGEKYLEACRLVRVDGFFRVAQDFRREEQYVFPANFLDDTSEITTYSTQITDSVKDFKNAALGIDDYPAQSPVLCVGNGTGCLNSPAMAPAYGGAISAGELPTWTEFSFSGTDALEQQLRSRGLYIDYMSEDLLLFLDECIAGDALVNDCCIRNGAKANQCTSKDLFLDKTNTTNVLEILPFFDVQITKLENWAQTAKETLPIGLTNEALADANAHSRGVISQVRLGPTDVTAGSHRGNLGFTNTLAIDPAAVFYSLVKEATLNVQSFDSTGGGSTTGPGPTPIIMSGMFSESVQGNPKITVTGAAGAICELIPGGYSCMVAADATAPTILVSGYEDTRSTNTETRYACSPSLTRISSNASLSNTNATFELTDFNGDLLSPSPPSTYNIVIQLTDLQSTACVVSDSAGG